MKLLIHLIVALTFGVDAWSQQTATTFRWNEVPAAQLPHGATLVTFGNQTALKIVNTTSTPLRLPLLTVPKPNISSKVYAVQGEARVEGLRGTIFMDLWSYFNQGAPHAARAEIHASENWSPYSVPFNSLGASAAPDRLQIDLTINGRGTVYLGPLKVVSYVDAAAYSGHNLGSVWFYGHTANPWWSNRTGVRMTNIETAILFIIGMILHYLCRKRKAMNIVALTLKIHIAIGFVLGVAAIIALFREQPFVVWFPLLLTAIILIGVYRVWLVSLGGYYRSG